LTVLTDASGGGVGAWRIRLSLPGGSGPLAGSRLAVKDVFSLSGYPVGAGNPAYLAEAEPARADAPALAALRAAGATVAGLAHTDELAFSLSGTNVHYGTPPNPAAPGLVPGGSSCGPASAVALDEADIGLGTDTAGSIRVPASCCGLFGFRPTHGVVPTEGVVPLAPSFDTVGWLTRDPATLAAVGDVLLPPAPAAEPERVVLIGLDAVHGWDVEIVRRPPAWLTRLSELLAAFRAVQAAEAWRQHGAWLTAHPDAGVADDVAARFRFGSTVDAEEEATARAALREWRKEIVDGGAWLVLPAAAGPGHSRAATSTEKEKWRMATLARTVPASATGLPSLVVPTAGTPPVGLALVGPPGSDRSLLAWAQRWRRPSERR
jgi:Asp-tRNA(Asn)/Glu-tRNA(Gln) amidotransferase A subunit family amidase